MRQYTNYHSMLFFRIFVPAIVKFIYTGGKSWFPTRIPANMFESARNAMNDYCVEIFSTYSSYCK